MKGFLLLPTCCDRLVPSGQPVRGDGHRGVSVERPQRRPQHAELVILVEAGAVEPEQVLVVSVVPALGAVVSALGAVVPTLVMVVSLLVLAVVVASPRFELVLGGGHPAGGGLVVEVDGALPDVYGAVARGRDHQLLAGVEAEAVDRAGVTGVLKAERVLVGMIDGCGWEGGLESVRMSEFHKLSDSDTFPSLQGDSIKCLPLEHQLALKFIGKTRW